MTWKAHRSLALTLVFSCLAVLFVAPAGTAGKKLVSTKDLEPPSDEARRVAARVFEDELPRVSAIEKARLRGASRGDTTTIRLLAIRVEFVPDADARSTGDGTFDYSDWDGRTFDGPPHDREYFELHMLALKKYYETVSYGRLRIEFEVAPADSRSAYVLPEAMGYYHDFSEEQVWYVNQVESFVRDAFASADEDENVDFSQFDGYILFHAGADWQSDVNLDSPFDLPSAHISLGEPIVVNDGSWEIWDAAIMPETSSQDGLTIVLNGTLAHEVGHTLGLPDLYNTSNFFPAIGYWGIMDSGGRIGLLVGDEEEGWEVFVYGLVPGPPCAWSKEFMGWLDPVVLLDDAEDVSVRASVLGGEGERLYKIPVTSDEYFLIENRLDDRLGDLTIAIDVEQGVALGPIHPDCDPDVEVCPVFHEYDFLMPGPGLLIYHIDDTRVIPGLMPYDTVNSDSHRRGVAVEEADGIMDLGNLYSFYWAGSRYDPFFAANNDSFAWDTFPSTDNNTGGKTYVAVTRISDAGAEMTMNVRFDRWKPGWPIDVGEPLGRMSPRVADLDADGVSEVLVAAKSGNVYAWRADGSPFIDSPIPESNGVFSEAPGGVSYTPAVADLDGDGDLEVIVASDAGSLYVWDHADSDMDGFADAHAPGLPVWLDGAASAAPLAADLDAGGGLEIAATSQGGYLTIVNHEGEHVQYSPYGFGHLVLEDVTLAAGDLDGDPEAELVMSTSNRGWVAALNADGGSVRGWPVAVDSWTDQRVGVLLGDLDREADGALEVVAVAENGEVRVWDRRGRMLPGWPADLGTGVPSRGALGDLEGDGYLEIVVPLGQEGVAGIRVNGTRVENWPLELDPGDSTGAASSLPLVGDLDGDEGLDVLIGGPDGNVFAWGGVSGDLLPGWPMSSDPSLGSPWAGDADGDGELDVLVVGDAGRVLFYGLPYRCDARSIVWPTEAASPAGTACYPDSLLGDAPRETPGLLAQDRTYCYPNPAVGVDPTLQIYLEETADLEIEFLDVTGQVVDRMTRKGRHTVNQFAWDTSGMASGLYIVRVTATGQYPESHVGFPRTRSRSETMLLKVAVVR